MAEASSGPPPAPRLRNARRECIPLGGERSEVSTSVVSFVLSVTETNHKVGGALAEPCDYRFVDDRPLARKRNAPSPSFELGPSVLRRPADPVIEVAR